MDFQACHCRTGSALAPTRFGLPTRKAHQTLLTEQWHTGICTHLSGGSPSHRSSVGKNPRPGKRGDRRGGEAREIAPKFTPALVARKLAAEKGGAITAVKDDEKVVFTAAFQG